MAGRITVASYEQLQAAEGAQMSVSVAREMPISDALAVRDRIRAKGWLLINPEMVNEKISRASQLKGEVAALHGISNNMLARADELTHKLDQP
uniref:Uncharacterized protein n=1 Tax=Leersia perrieri TaxID=77586 RepID=A0A0D9X510_9ORYZ